MWKPNAAACVPIASKWTDIFPVKFQLVSHNPLFYTMDTSKSFTECFVLCLFFLECGDVCIKFSFWVKTISTSWPFKYSQLNHFYRPQRSCGKVMFSQASVILFTGGGEMVWQTPPWADTPQQTATVADGSHPTVMHSCYREDSLNLQPRRPWQTRHIWITDQSLLDGETLWMLTVYSKVNLSSGSIEGPLSDSVNNLVNSFQVTN